MTKFYRSALLAAAIILIDQITKAVLASRDFFIGPVKVMLVKNYGLPFNIQTGDKLSLVVVIIGLVILSLYFLRLRRRLSRVEVLSLVLILAGGISNLGDRLVLGYVRDLIDFGWGFVFNLADFSIVIGLLMLLFDSGPRRQAGGQA